MLDNDKLVETQTPTDKKKTKVLKRASSKIFTSHDVRKFTERGVSQKSFHTGSIKFAKLYDPRHKYTRYFVAVLVGLVMSFLSVVLIQSTGLYTGGFGAICQGIARLTYASLNKNKIGTEESRLAIYNALY